MIVKYPLLIIVILALLLRLPLINGSFWMDEAAQALEIIRPLNQQLDIFADFQPPLLHFILHFAQYFSKSEWFLRTIGALIPGLITIIFSYKVAERLISKRVAFITGLLLATSSFHIFYSQELRPYSLQAALAMMSMYFFLDTVGQISKQKSFVLLTIVNALGLYSTYLHPFFMLFQITYAFLNKNIIKNKSLLRSFAISILTFVPFLPIFVRQLLEGSKVRAILPGWEMVVSVEQIKALPFVFGKLIFGVLPLDLNPMTVLLGSFAGIFGVGVIYHIYKNLNKFDFKLFFFWLVVPILIAWIVSFAVPIIQPKRLLFYLPAIYMLIAYVSTESFANGIKKVAKNVPFRDKTGAGLIIMVLLINVIGIIGYYTNPKLQRENWKELTSEIYNTFIPNETLLIFSFTDSFAPIKWYEMQAKEKFPQYATGELYIDNTNNLPNSLKIAASYKTVLVFDYLRNLTDPNRKIESVLTQLGFKEVGVLDYPSIGFVRVFMQPIEVIGLK